MNKRVVAAVAALVFAISGCATIVNGTKQPVSFSSNPEGAEVVVDGASRGVTPTTVELSRSSSNAHVELRKAGYETAEETLHSSISGYYFMNLLLGGVVGLVLDAVDGSWYGYDDDLHANLMPIMATAAPAQTAPALAVASDHGRPQVAIAPTTAPEDGNSPGYNPNADRYAIDREMH